MIDVSQWRASIGLWNYCQAASSRPTKATVDSKSGSITSEEKTSKLPAALSLVAFLLYLSLSIDILMIPPSGKQQLQLCTCTMYIYCYFIIRYLLPSTMYYWCYCY